MYNDNQIYTAIYMDAVYETRKKLIGEIEYELDQLAEDSDEIGYYIPYAAVMDLLKKLGGANEKI